MSTRFSAAAAISRWKRTSRSSHGSGGQRRVGGVVDDAPRSRQVLRRPALGGEVARTFLEGAPRLEQLGDVDGVEVEEDVHRLAEVARDRVGIRRG